jgi:hypothetical protein
MATEAGYRRLWAGVWDWNVASRRVLEKLGFREAGRVQPVSAHGGEPTDRDLGGSDQVQARQRMGSTSVQPAERQCRSGRSQSWGH